MQKQELLNSSSNLKKRFNKINTHHKNIDRDELVKLIADVPSQGLPATVKRIAQESWVKAA